jgi:methylmalonyl-CoA mutase cobalamin-binding subunit
MLFATPPGDEHAFGIELASCLAATRGFPICVLGANVPAAEVLRASRHVRPSTVVIGSIRLQSLADFVAYVSVLDGELAPETQLWIGGPGIPPSWPEKWSPRVHHVATLEDFIERL